MSDRLALIIANSEYDDPKLARLVTPSRDAEALAEVLSDPAIGGFEVTLLVDETEPVVRRGIARLYHRRKRGDLLLLYYSGHGIRDEHGDLYLATRNTEMDFVSATALSAAFVRGQIDKSGSQRKVVVLDCCHSGAFAGAKTALGEGAGTQEAFAGSGYGRVILTASNALEFAWEGDELPGEAERTSVFTHFLVEGIQTGAAGRAESDKISIDELHHYVREKIIDSGRSRQTPQMWALKVEGRIIIAKKPRSVVKPAELPLELRQPIESPFAEVREGAVRALERLLHGSDKGLALAAQEALTRLADDDSRTVSAAAARALGVSPVAVPAKPSPAPPPPIVEKAEPEPEPELHPSLALKLSVKPQTVDAGGEATWTVTLRNDGDDDLRDVTVQHGSRGLEAPFVLAVGKERRFTFTTTCKTEGRQTERVTVSGIASSGETVRDEAGATVQVRPQPELHPSLALKLSVKPQTVDVGGEATWTVTLRNDGDDDLRHVTVRRGRTLLDEPFDLAVGKGRRFTFTTTCKTEGRKTERVTVSGIASSGETVRDEARATVQVRLPRPVTPKPEPAPKPKTPAKPAPDVLTITSPIHLELVRVPAGEFLMGSDPAKDNDAEDNEQPQHRVYVSEFYIGKYPVTNAQYAAFVKATPYMRMPDYWDDNGKIPLGYENHPVTVIFWDEAVAFCEWLSRETGKPFRLPTEAEWEKAARGTDGRLYPWGNQHPTAELCNFDNPNLDTTPVGRYSPQGDSPYGCADMAGNVEEWTRSLWGEEWEKPTFKYPYDPRDGREDVDAPVGVLHVLRGGSFDSSRRSVRCACRQGAAGATWDLGFRPVVAPVASDH